MKKNDLKNEKWLPIANNENYEVSNMGRVRNTKKGNILTPISNGQKENDYLFVILNGTKHYLHHVVLFAFEGKKPADHECDHINSNRQDNRLSNLRYATISENRSHKGEKHGKAKLNNRLVLLIRKMVSEGYMQKDIAEIINVTASTISSVVRGKTWQHI